MKLDTALLTRVATAVSLDPSLQVTLEKLQEASGHEENYFESLGVRTADLKKLEVWGLAKRGYLKGKKRWTLISPT